MNLFTLSWKNITHRPLTMGLNLILFGLGIGLISFLFLLEKQLQDNFEKNLGGIDLVIGAKGSPLQLILSSMYHIDAPTGNITIREAKAFLNPKHPLISQATPLSLGDSYRSYRIVGTDSSFLSLYNAEINRGKIWTENFEVTVGAEVANELGFEIGDEFVSSHGFTDSDLGHSGEIPFKVVGILKPTGSVADQLILTTTPSFWLVHEHEEETESDDETHDHEAHEENSYIDPGSLIMADPDREITSLLLKFKARNYQALNMQRNINENTDIQAATPAIEINRLFNLMNTGEQALRLLALIITFVSGLSIFISLYSSLKERAYELSLMRVSGASPSKLFIMIILEGLILSGLGFIIGIVISHTGMMALASTMKSEFRYNFAAWEFLPQEFYLLIGSLFLGFLAAIIPAISASRTDIANTLTKG